MNHRRVDFGDAIEDVTRGQLKLQRRDYISSGLLPVVDQGQDLIGGYTNSREYTYSGSLPVIVFGDHTRIFKYIDFPFALGADGVKVLKPKADLDPKFLYYYFQSVPLASLGYSRHFKLLRELEIPVPPLAEQRRIVDILDRANGIRRLRQEALEKARQIIPALFVEIFGDPVSDPRHWAVTHLGELVDQRRGISYGIVQRGADVADGVPVLRISNIINNSFDGTEIVRTLPEISARYKRTVLHGGELLLSIRGTVGHVAVAPPGAAGFNVSREIAVIPLVGSVNGDYARLLMLSDGAQRFMAGEIRGIAQRGINLRDVRNLPVPLPPSRMQEDLADRVADLEAMIAQQERMAEASEQLAASLMAQLFDGGTAQRDATKVTATAHA